MTKKNREYSYASSTPNNNDLVLDGKKIITTVVAALLVGALFGAFAISRLSEFNNFRIDSNIKAIEEVKEVAVHKDVYAADLREVNSKLDLILQNFDLKYND